MKKIIVGLAAAAALAFTAAPAQAHHNPGLGEFYNVANYWYSVNPAFGTTHHTYAASCYFPSGWEGFLASCQKEEWGWGAISPDYHYDWGTPGVGGYGKCLTQIAITHGSNGAWAGQRTSRNCWS